MDYLLHIAIMANIYIILVLAANLPAGMSGLMSLCQGAFYGLGAYFGAFFLLRTGLPFPVIVIAVMFFVGITSLLVSVASVRLKGDYFVLASLGFQMIVFTVLYNWVDVTRGPYGISGIPDIQLIGKGIGSLSGIDAYFILTTVLAACSAALFLHLKRSPFGRLLRALRDDEHVLVALGRDPARIKFQSFFSISCVFGACRITLCCVHRLHRPNFVHAGRKHFHPLRFIYWRHRQCSRPCRRGCVRGSPA